VDFYQPKSLVFDTGYQWAYSGGYGSKNILWFQRDTLTGELIFSGSLDQKRDGIPDLSTVRHLILTRDGRFLYATCSEANSVVWFSRSALGDLVFEGSLKNQQGGADGLLDPRFMVMSADQEFVYVGAQMGNRILWFARDSLSGSLTYRGQVVDGENAVDGLDGVQGMKLTADGRFLYAAGMRDNAISWFLRSAETGALTFSGIAKDTAAENNPWDGAGAVEITSNGRVVFLGTYRGHAVIWFRRDPETGNLQLGGVSQEGEKGVTGIKGIEYLTLTPDEKRLYVSGGISGSLAWFQTPDSSRLAAPIRGKNPAFPSRNPRVSARIKKGGNWHFEIRPPMKKVPVVVHDIRGCILFRGTAIDGYFSWAPSSERKGEGPFFLQITGPVEISIHRISLLPDANR
jgi:6-phosphogluconolactonase (cycloisomerase 2 family)